MTTSNIIHKPYLNKKRNDSVTFSQLRLIIRNVLSVVVATSGKSTIVTAMVSNSIRHHVTFDDASNPVPTDIIMPPISSRSGDVIPKHITRAFASE